MEARKPRRKRALATRRAPPLVARYTCGHALELAPRGDADTRCVGCGCGELLGVMARAA